MALSEAERRALLDRGINPRYFDPRLVGDFSGFEFSGNFGEDLRSLNQIFNQPTTELDWGMEDLRGGRPGAAYQGPSERRSTDYLRALDSLFQNYPDQETFQTADGQNLYMDVGLPYFRQGDRTGYMPGSELGGFSTYHINNDSDAFESIMGLPPIQGLTGLLTGGLSNLITGGGELGSGGGILDAINLATDIADYEPPGQGNTVPGAPEGGYGSIYDPDPNEIPGVPGMDLPGPGGAWDLIDIEIPGGGQDAGQPAPAPGPSTPPSAPGQPPWLEPEPGDPDYVPDEPTEAPPVLEQPTLPPGGGGGDFNLPLPPIDWGWGSNGGNDGMADWTDFIPDIPGVTDLDWQTILNPTTSSTATGGSVGDINIDFGDLASALAGLYAGYDQSQQDPQYPTLRDLYGGEYEAQMEGLRDQILAQDPSSWVADLTPEQMAAISGMTGWATGPGGEIFDQQRGQGTMGMGGLGAGMGYADYLRGTGGPQFEFDQDVFDQTMRNLMPGIEGSYVNQTRDLVRNLNENLLPGIEMDALQTGNTAASRTGIAQGIAERGTLDRMGDIESQLIQNAINQAQETGYGAGMGNLEASLGTQGDIFGGYGTTAQYGLPGLGEAWTTGVGNYETGLYGGNILQNMNQAYLDAPRNLMGWQIPLINQTTPAGAGNLGTPYTAPSPLTAMMEGMNFGTGIYDAWQNVFGNPFSTTANAAGGGR